MGTVIAVVAALGAACCFAFAAVMQHGAARDAGGTALNRGLLLRLARNPRWLAASALGALSFVIQGLALAFGPLTLVQPLAATDVLFALPMIAVAHRYRLTRRDWTAAAAVAAGLAVFLALTPPGAGISAPGVAAWAPVILASAAIVASSILVAVRTSGSAPGDRPGRRCGCDLRCPGRADQELGGPALRPGRRGIAALGARRGAGRGHPRCLPDPELLPRRRPVGQPARHRHHRAGQRGHYRCHRIRRTARTSPAHLAIQLAGGAVAAAGIAALSHSSVEAAETRPQPKL